MSYPPYYNLPIVLCEFFIALIAKEPYSALCFLVLIKKSHLVFIVFFVEFVVECRFYSLIFLWHLWRFRVHNSCSSCLVIIMGNFGYESFFGWEIWQKMAKTGTIFLNFFLCNFSGFFCFLRQVSWAIVACLLFCEHLVPLMAEENFSLDLYAFVILRNLLTFSSFLVQVVFESFFS